MEVQRVGNYNLLQKASYVSNVGEKFSLWQLAMGYLMNRMRQYGLAINLVVPRRKYIVLPEVDGIWPKKLLEVEAPREKDLIKLVLILKNF